MHDVQLFQHVLLVRSTEETIFGWRTQVGDALPPGTGFDETLASWSILHVYAKKQVFCWPLHSNPERALFRSSHWKPIHQGPFRSSWFPRPRLWCYKGTRQGYSSQLSVGTCTSFGWIWGQMPLQLSILYKSLGKDVASEAESTRL